MGAREEDETSQDQPKVVDPPKDAYNLVYVIYLLLGAGFLMPWNVFITAVDYFDFLYPDTHIDRVFSVLYMVPCLIFLTLITIFGRKYSSWGRINLGLFIFLLAIVVVPVLDAAVIRDGSRGVSLTFYVTIAAVVATGICDALVQGSLYGSVGELPGRYMQALVAGTAASGVLVSFLRILTKAFFPQTPQGLRASANLYFLVCVVFMTVCLFAYNAVGKLPVMRYYQDVAYRAKASEGSSLLLSQNVGNEGSEIDHVARVVVADVKGDRSLKEGSEHVSFQQVVGKVKWLGSAMLLIYVVTLAIFPGYLTEDVKSDSLGDWYPIILVALYNVGDLAGKWATAAYLIENHPVLIGGCVARLLFFPLFAVCLHGPALLRTEVPVVVLTILLGVTNGYLTSALFIVAPKSVSIEETETTGMVMVLFLAFGLALGSVVGWVWII